MPNNLPYGNAYLVSTPSLDHYGLQLYQEQRQKEQQAQQDSRLLDQNMQSELGKIRSADTPEFINAYEDYKTIKKQLYNPKVQRNATEVHKINQDAQIALAKAMQLANSSIEFKEQLKGLNSEYSKNPIYFNDDFKNKFETTRNTPLSKLSNFNPNDFYYKGNVTNIQPKLDKAKGILIERGTPEINDNYSKTEREITSFKGLNSPRQYYNLVVGSLAGSRSHQDLVGSYNFTPEEEQRITEEYNQKVRDNPTCQKVYGKENLQFPESSDFSEAGRITKLLAMEHGLQALRTETKRETKKDEQMAQQDVYTMKHIAAMNRNAIGRLKYAFDLREMGDTDENLAGAGSVINEVGSILGKGEQQVKSMKGVLGVGQTANSFEISDPTMIKYFSDIDKDGKTVRIPDKIRYDKTKDEVQLVYPAHTIEYADGTKKEIPEEVKPIDGRTYMKLKVGQTYPAKDKGKMNQIIDKIYDQSGTLYGMMDKLKTVQTKKEIPKTQPPQSKGKSGKTIVLPH